MYIHPYRNCNLDLLYVRHWQPWQNCTKQSINRGHWPINGALLVAKIDQLQLNTLRAQLAEITPVEMRPMQGVVCPYARCPVSARSMVHGAIRRSASAANCHVAPWVTHTAAIIIACAINLAGAQHTLCLPPVVSRITSTSFVLGRVHLDESVGLRDQRTGGPRKPLLVLRTQYIIYIICTYSKIGPFKPGPHLFTSSSSIIVYCSFVSGSVRSAVECMRAPCSHTTSVGLPF